MIWNSILVDGIFLRKRVVNLVWNIQRHMYIVPSTAAAVWPTISFMVLLSIFTAQHTAKNFQHNRPTRRGSLLQEQSSPLRRKSRNTSSTFLHKYLKADCLASRAGNEGPGNILIIKEKALTFRAAFPLLKAFTLLSVHQLWWSLGRSPNFRCYQSVLIDSLLWKC